ncbi:Flagellar hook-associated protein [Sulfitobacter donghicola DSW-25 = KCTC 12864 = JCM 14565]|nr:Flagellar hook-associated protein [Sulfitobacter donghicola DSW-25 = KCTC 12864 = JCM 14565]
MVQSRSTALKQDIQRLTTELASGNLVDVREAIGGNTAYINDLERNLTKLDGYDLTTVEAGQLTGGAQVALEQIGSLATSFRDSLLTANNSGTSEVPESLIAEANANLDGVIAAMNTEIGGRSIFAGTATNSAAITSSEDLLAALTTAVSGASSVDDMLVLAEAWFDDPAGFESTAYLGSDQYLSPIPLSERNEARLDVRADDPVFRDTLRNIALVAISNDPSLALTPSQQGDLIQKSIGQAFTNSDAIIDIQAEVGVTESQIERVSVSNSAERTSLELARSNLLSADPFEAATELEQVQFQLQSLFTITSRMSQLSLVNFL